MPPPSRLATFRPGIVAGFGDPLIQEFDALGRRKFLDVRDSLNRPYNVRPGMAEPPPDVPRIQMKLAEYASPLAQAWGIVPFWIVMKNTIPFLPSGSRACFYNEPNLHDWTADAYAEELKQALEIADRAGVTLYGGGASNTTPDLVKWMARVIQLVPELRAVEWHEYGRGGKDRGNPEKAHDGYRNRDEQMDAVLAVVEWRRLRIGENGVETGAYRYKRLWWHQNGFVSEEQQRRYLEWVLSFYASTRAIEVAYLYQLQDDAGSPGGAAPSLTRAEGWGIRQANGGPWKLSASVAMTYAQPPMVPVPPTPVPPIIPPSPPQETPMPLTVKTFDPQVGTTVPHPQGHVGFALDPDAIEKLGVSNTSGQPGAVAMVTDSGNFLVVAETGAVLWAARPGLNGTGELIASGRVLVPGENVLSPDGRTQLSYQIDHNLVLYRKDASGAWTPVWASNTGGKTPVSAAMQVDGNFVLTSSVGGGFVAVTPDGVLKTSPTLDSLDTQFHEGKDGELYITRTLGRYVFKPIRPKV